ncbi:unnamed protein product, partial [Dibothriocephalus latus]
MSFTAAFPEIGNSGRFVFEVSSILAGGKSGGGDFTNHKGSAMLSLSSADAICNELDGGDGASSGG